MAALTPCFGCSLSESVPNKAIYLLPLKDGTFGGSPDSDGTAKL